MSNEKIYNNLLAQLDRLFRHNRQGSYKTRQRYYEAMKRFCRFLTENYRMEKLANIGSKHIDSYTSFMKAMRLSASTIKTDLAAIRFWHDQMPNARHKLPGNEALNLEQRNFGRVDRTWSNAEFNKMIGVCWKHEREDYVAVLCLARYAGFRIHECFRVDTATAEDAVRKMVITIKGKNGKIRTVPIQESIRIELEKMLAVTKRGHKLFVPDGVMTDHVMKDFQRFIREHRDEVKDSDSTRPMTCHGLRHNYAVEQYLSLVEKGYSDSEAKRQVSRWTGHNREDVTRIYLASLRNTGEEHKFATNEHSYNQRFLQEVGDEDVQ